MPAAGRESHGGRKPQAVAGDGRTSYWNDICLLYISATLLSHGDNRCHERTQDGCCGLNSQRCLRIMKLIMDLWIHCILPSLQYSTLSQRDGKNRWRGVSGWVVTCLRTDSPVAARVLHPHLPLCRPPYYRLFGYTMTTPRKIPVPPLDVLTRAASKQYLPNRRTVWWGISRSDCQGRSKHSCHSCSSGSASIPPAVGVDVTIARTILQGGPSCVAMARQFRHYITDNVHASWQHSGKSCVECRVSCARERV